MLGIAKFFLSGTGVILFHRLHIFSIHQEVRVGILAANLHMVGVM